MSKKVSIVIPTWNHLDDLLKPCVESIERNTSDKYDLEFIFVSNGSTDDTWQWLEQLHEKNHNKYRHHITIEQLGFTRAANIGFKMATADYVIILNNDTEILDWGGKDAWLDKLFAPFDADATVAATGPLKIYDFYSNREFLVGFCVMYKMSVLKEYNYFDEAYAPAGGEDVDLAIRLQDGGWEIEAVQKTIYNGKTNVGDFPMWHKDNKSYGLLPEYTKTVVKRNGHLNCKRHNKNIKLNIGGGGINYKGYLNVDLYDQRADIIMDITKPMDFGTDSVTEILASHLFEHLNPYKSMDILREWFRILAPGGKLIMELPDIEQLCKRFISANKQERYGILNAIYGSVNTTDNDDPSKITSPHLFGWWPESLYDHLANSGFVDIKILPEQIPHPESNLRVEATKPGIPIQVSKLEPIKNIDSPRHQKPEPEPESIIQINEYGINTEEVKNRRVIDIGASTGEFIKLVKSLGAIDVVATESDPVKYKQLCDATKNISGVVVMNAQLPSGEQPVGIRVSDVIKMFPSDQNLVLKLSCGGREFDWLFGATPDDIRHFSIICVELHERRISGHDVSELIKYLADNGFNPIETSPPIMYTEKDEHGDVLKEEVLTRRYKFIRGENIPVAIIENPQNPYGVTAYISTKDRYSTTLPLAIVGIANQTFKVDELILFDDGEQKDLRQESLYSNIFRYLEMKGISWKVIFGEKRGQVANHQKAIELAKTEYIWRVDDDNYPEPEVLARLMLWCTCKVEDWEQPFGAVGSLVRVPHQEVFSVEKCSGDIQRCIDTSNLQWSAFSGVLHTDHLHNTFLFKRSAAKHGYQKNLSPVGHREETLFTHGIKMNGYRLLVCGDVITWHFRESTGGIRAYNDVKLWEHDDKIFLDEMKKRGVLFDEKKYIVLDNGIGDHYAFKNILPELIKKYQISNIVIASCFPEVFESFGVRQISIAEAHTLFGDLTKFNIYHWMWKSDWKKSIVDAFRTMYLLA